MTYLVLTVLVVVIVFQGWLIISNRKLYERRFSELNEYCTKERQQLLDRIQASSFAEYKTQEVRVIKAQSNVQEQPKLEQL